MQSELRRVHRSERGDAAHFAACSQRSDLQLPTDRLDPVFVAVRVGERLHVLGRRSSSAWTKYADALRRISFAWRSSRFFLSRSLSHSRSALVRPDRTPSSTSARRTHLRNVSAEQPIFDDTETMADHRRFLRPMGQARDHVPCALLKLVHLHSSFDGEGGDFSVTLSGDYWMTPDKPPGFPVRFSNQSLIARTRECGVHEFAPLVSPTFEPGDEPPRDPDTYPHTSAADRHANPLWADSDGDGQWQDGNRASA